MIFQKKNRSASAFHTKKVDEKPYGKNFKRLNSANSNLSRKCRLLSPERTEQDRVKAKMGKKNEQLRGAAQQRGNSQRNSHNDAENSVKNFPQLLLISTMTALQKKRTCHTKK